MAGARVRMRCVTRPRFVIEVRKVAEEGRGEISVLFRFILTMDMDMVVFRNLRNIVWA